MVAEKVTVYYTNRDVHEAALARINRLFDEFKNVVVFFSGGKDSTVIMELTIQVAKERGRLPVPVLFIDQEAEWQNAIDYIRTVMDREDVDNMWFQMPIRLSNATSAEDEWLYCWDKDSEDVWMRPMEPDSIKSLSTVEPNILFYDIFNAVLEHYYPNEPVAAIGGLRAEESPRRRAGLTNSVTYQDITWGKVLNSKKQHFTFYPIYDWSYRDIWKTIHDNQYKYCKIYDYQYQQGITVPNMRVSNLHHETALTALNYLAKVEPNTWAKLTKRLHGINSYKHTQLSYNVPSVLPYMFADWEEYRDYLVEKLPEKDKKHKFTDRFKRDLKFMKKIEASRETTIELHKSQIRAVLLNDYFFVTLDNFISVLDLKMKKNELHKKNS